MTEGEGRAHLANMTVSAISALEVLAADWTRYMLLAADFVGQESRIVLKVEVADEAIVVTSDFMMLQRAPGLEFSKTTFKGTGEWIGAIRCRHDE